MTRHKTARMMKPAPEPSVPISPEDPKNVTDFVSMLEALRVAEETLKATPITLAEPSPGLPASLEEARPFVKNYKSAPAYLIGKDLKIITGNWEAETFVGFERLPVGKSALVLVEQIAKNFLSDPSQNRFPKEDFIAQQTLLSLLARDGLYQMPDVTLRIAKMHGGREIYQALKIIARPLFSPERAYLGTFCRLAITNLDKEAYQAYWRKDEIISPLPEEIVAMVQARAEMIEKNLKQGPPTPRVKGRTQTEPPVTDPTIETEEDLSRLFNLPTFQRAVASIPKTTEGMEHLGRLNDFVVDRVQATIQNEIKRRLWPGEKVPGTVGFHIVPDHGKYYLRAQISGKTPKNIRPLTPEETRDHLARKQREQSSGLTR